MIKVYCFGNTENGELGLGAIEDEHILLPRKQRLPFDRRKFSLIQLSSGRNHTLILLKNIQIDQNVIFSCGSNDRLQLGRGGSWKKLEQIDGLNHHNIVKISCGSNNCLALSEAGQLFSWGCNLFGQLGLGDCKEFEIGKPSLIKKLATNQIVQISCGGNHCLALSKNGEIYSWGSNAFGQLGIGNSGNCISTPMLITSLQWTPIRQISAGGSHSAILSYTGAIYLWGKNEFGQLGLSDTENRCLPTLQRSLRNQKISYINLGDEHSAALTIEGGLFTWGAGMYGQLGHGRNTNEILPRKVFELMGVRIVQVSCGRCHTLVVNKLGRIYSFGLNGSGQLGIGNTNSKYLPCSIRGKWSELNTKDVVLRDNELSLLLVDEQSFTTTNNNNNNNNQMTSDTPSSTNNQLSDSMMEINEMETTVNDYNNDNTDNENEFIIEEPDEQHYHKQQQQHQQQQQKRQKNTQQEKKFVCAKDLVYDDESNETIQIDEYESDPDSDQEEGPNPLQSFCKEIVAGKGDHSFIITESFIDHHHLNQQQQTPKDYRRINIDDEIIKMKADLFEQLPLSISKSIPLDLVDYIETIFSSIPTINASFISSTNNSDIDNNNNNNNNETKLKLNKFKDSENINNINNNELINFYDGWINWKQAFHFFNVIEDAQNERIDELIYQLLQKLLTNLPDILYNNEKKLLHDIEIMRCYQIIPLYHQFHMPTYEIQSQKLITLFAKTILSLSEPSKNSLKLLWYNMNRRFFKNFLEIFKNSVKLNLYEQYKDNQLAIEEFENQNQQQQNNNNNQINNQPSTSSTETITPEQDINLEKKLQLKNYFHNSIRENLSVSLLLLKELYRINKFSEKLSYKEFYINNIDNWFDLEYDYNLWKYNQNQHMKNRFYLCNFPFIFDAPAKTIILASDSRKQQRSAANKAMQKQMLISLPLCNDGRVIVNPYIDITVRRENLLEDAIHQLDLYSKYGESDLKKPLRVFFKNEEAIDAGAGMKKEFFLLLMKEVLDQKYGMFIEYQETNTIWFNHFTTNNDDDDVMYRLIGILCGLAIYNQVIIDLPFPLPLYKKILNEKLELNDLTYLDPILAKNLKEILSTTYERNEFNAIYGDITFVITLTTFGSPVEYELCEGGKQQQLNYDNREKYVELYWKYILIESIRKQFQSFYAGFMKVLDKEILKIFHAEELMQLVEGEELIDWNELESSTTYQKPFNRDHSTIKLFWKVFNSLSTDEKRKFLKFLTGSDRIPVTGVKSMKIKIQPMNVSDDHLPVAHTCFNILDLPLEYQSSEKNREELMRKNILKACEYCIEFALV